MPTVAVYGPYRLFFYSNDRTEPIHVHVSRGRSVAKYWLTPVVLVRSVGFARAELRQVQRIVTEHAADIERVWNEFFAE